MGVVARQSIRGAIANYVGIAIGFVTTFFVLTDCLSQEEIGLTRVMVDAALLFSGLAQLGTNASIIRFFPYFKSADDERNHGIFGWSVLIPFIGFLLFLVGFLLFREEIVEAYSGESPLLVDYCYLLLPLTFFALYLTVFETNASVLMRITVPRVVREVVIRVFNLICYLLYGNGIISLDLFVGLFCGSYGVAMLLNMGYLFSLGKISFRIDWKFLSKPMLKDMLRYTLFMTIAVMAGNIPLINSLFLGAKEGLALTGVYTIAFYIANIVEVPYRSLGAISRPLVAQAVKDKNWSEVNHLCRQVSLHQLLVASLIYFFICINLKALFAVIPHGAEYLGGIGVVFLLGLAKIVNSSFSISADVLNYSKHYPMTLVFNILLTLSAIVLNGILISWWGINGAAGATLFAYIIYFVVLMLFNWFSMRVALFSKGQLKVLALVGVLVALNWLWTRWLTPLFGDGTPMLIVESGVRTLCLMGLGLFLVFRMHVSQEVDNLILKIIKH